MSHFFIYYFNIHCTEVFLYAGWTHTKWTVHKFRCGSIITCIHFSKNTDVTFRDVSLFACFFFWLSHWSLPARYITAVHFHSYCYHIRETALCYSECYIYCDSDYTFHDHAIHQPIICRSLTTQALVHSHTSLRGICGGWSGTFSLRTLVFPLSVLFHQCSLIIYPSPTLHKLNKWQRPCSLLRAFNRMRLRSLCFHHTQNSSKQVNTARDL